MISVLMPVYNVEKYIEKTLTSVQNQTYKDFEVIMIDDGSTDSSGAICDKWSAKDSRFKAFHQKNSGVSVARNNALSYAKGEYIFFMDSDDLILEETFEEMLNLLHDNNADFVLGNTYYTDNKGNPLQELNKTSPVKNETLTNIQYIKKLTQPNANYYCTLCMKLYKKEVFNDIVFPVNRINEDESVIHKIAYNCKKIVTTDKRYYNYIKHKVSITGADFSLKNLDREQAFVDRINFLTEKGLKDLAEQTALLSLDAAIVTFTKCIKNNYFYGQTKKRVLSYFDFFYKYAKKCKNTNEHEKKVLLISKIIVNCPIVYEKYIELNAKIDSMGKSEAVKDELFEFILKCFSLLPTKNRIIFESHPEMTCNTYPVYKYLMEKGLNEKYAFVWLSENKNQYIDFKEKNVKFLNYSKSASSVTEKLKYMYYISTAKALVYSNQLLGTYGRNRISLWLQHGMPLKASNGTYCIKNRCTVALCESEFFADNFSLDSRVDKDKLIYFGFPRNDYLLEENDSFEKLNLTQYDKVIFWLPTFRQRNDNAKNKKVNNFEMKNHGTGIPSIETEEDIKKVNDYLKDNNCLLILKPHPVQDMSSVKKEKLSNFYIMNDDTLKENNIQLYMLLGKCDAMITDYSSVYYDYLLTDKPIGLTIGDIDEYTSKRGFVYKQPLDILKGEYINNTDDLIRFIDNVKNENDIAKEERTKVKNMIHTVQDGSSTKAVGDYIINQLTK